MIRNTECYPKFDFNKHGITKEVFYRTLNGFLKLPLQPSDGLTAIANAIVHYVETTSSSTNQLLNTTTYARIMTLKQTHSRSDIIKFITQSGLCMLNFVSNAEIKSYTDIYLCTAVCPNDTEAFPSPLPVPKRYSKNSEKIGKLTKQDVIDICAVIRRLLQSCQIASKNKEKDKIVEFFKLNLDKIYIYMRYGMHTDACFLYLIHFNSKYLNYFLIDNIKPSFKHYLETYLGATYNQSLHEKITPFFSIKNLTVEYLLDQIPVDRPVLITNLICKERLQYNHFLACRNKPQSYLEAFCVFEINKAHRLNDLERRSFTRVMKKFLVLLQKVKKNNEMDGFALSSFPVHTKYVEEFLPHKVDLQKVEKTFKYGPESDGLKSIIDKYKFGYLLTKKRSLAVKDKEEDLSSPIKPIGSYYSVAQIIKDCQLFEYILKKIYKNNQKNRNEIINFIQMNPYKYKLFCMHYINTTSLSILIKYPHKDLAFCLVRTLIVRQPSVLQKYLNVENDYIRYTRIRYLIAVSSCKSGSLHFLNLLSLTHTHRKVLITHEEHNHYLSYNNFIRQQKNNQSLLAVYCVHIVNELKTVETVNEYINSRKGKQKQIWEWFKPFISQNEDRSKIKPLLFDCRNSTLYCNLTDNHLTRRFNFSPLARNIYNQMLLEQREFENTFCKDTPYSLKMINQVMRPNQGCEKTYRGVITNQQGQYEGAFQEQLIRFYWLLKHSSKKYGLFLGELEGVYLCGTIVIQQNKSILLLVDPRGGSNLNSNIFFPLCAFFQIVYEKRALYFNLNSTDLMTKSGPFAVACFNKLYSAIERDKFIIPSRMISPVPTGIEIKALNCLIQPFKSKKVIVDSARWQEMLRSTHYNLANRHEFKETKFTLEKSYDSNCRQDTKAISEVYSFSDWRDLKQQIEDNSYTIGDAQANTDSFFYAIAQCYSYVKNKFYSVALIRLMFGKKMIDSYDHTIVTSLNNPERIKKMSISIFTYVLLYKQKHSFIQLVDDELYLLAEMLEHCICIIDLDQKTFQKYDQIIDFNLNIPDIHFSSPNHADLLNLSQMNVFYILKKGLDFFPVLPRTHSTHLCKRSASPSNKEPPLKNRKTSEY